MERTIAEINGKLVIIVDDLLKDRLGIKVGSIINVDDVFRVKF